MMSDRFYQRILIDWLGEIVAATGIQTFVPVLRHRMRRQSDDRQGKPFGSQGGRSGIAIQLRHLHIHQNEIKRLTCLYSLGRLFTSNSSVFGNRDACAGLLEVERDHTLIVNAVLSEQDVGI